MIQLAGSYVYATDVVSSVHAIEEQLKTELEFVFGNGEKVFGRMNRKRRSAFAPSQAANTQDRSGQPSSDLPALDHDHVACGGLSPTSKENMPVYDQ